MTDDNLPDKILGLPVKYVDTADTAEFKGGTVEFGDWSACIGTRTVGIEELLQIADSIFDLKPDLGIILTKRRVLIFPRPNTTGETMMSPVGFVAKPGALNWYRRFLGRTNRFKLRDDGWKMRYERIAPPFIQARIEVEDHKTPGGWTITMGYDPETNVLAVLGEKSP